MNKKCVFKCLINGKWYRVYECVHPDDKHRNAYQTYVGRKRLDVLTWVSLGAAIGSILCEYHRTVVFDLIEVWK